MQGLWLACGYRETEGAREGFGTIKVGLLEFEPGQVGDFDRRIDRASAVLASVGAVLAVEVGVPVGCDHVVISHDVSFHRTPRAVATMSAGSVTAVPLQAMCRSGRTRTRRCPYSWHNRGSPRIR